MPILPGFPPLFTATSAEASREAIELSKTFKNPWQTGSTSREADGDLKIIGKWETVFTVAPGDKMGHIKMAWDNSRRRYVAMFSMGLDLGSDEPMENIMTMYSMDGIRGRAWSVPTVGIPYNPIYDGIMSPAGLIALPSDEWLIAVQQATTGNLGAHLLEVYVSNDAGTTWKKRGEIPNIDGYTRTVPTDIVTTPGATLLFGWRADRLQIPTYETVVWISYDRGRTWAEQLILEPAGGGANEVSATWYQGQLHCFIRTDTATPTYRLIHKVLNDDASSVISSEEIQDNMPNYRGQSPTTINFDDRWLGILYRNNWTGQNQTSISITDFTTYNNHTLSTDGDFGSAFFRTGLNTMTALVNSAQESIETGEFGLGSGLAVDGRFGNMGYRKIPGSPILQLEGKTFIVSNGSEVGTPVTSHINSDETVQLDISSQLDISDQAVLDALTGGTFTLGMRFRPFATPVGTRRVLLGNTLTTAAIGFRVILDNQSNSPREELDISIQNGESGVAVISQKIRFDQELVIANEFITVVITADGSSMDVLINNIDYGNFPYTGNPPQTGGTLPLVVGLDSSAEGACETSRIAVYSTVLTGVDYSNFLKWLG